LGQGDQWQGKQHGDRNLNFGNVLKQPSIQQERGGNDRKRQLQHQKYRCEPEAYDRRFCRNAMHLNGFMDSEGGFDMYSQFPDGVSSKYIEAQVKSNVF
jgi:hypothetical protein